MQRFNPWTGQPLTPFDWDTEYYVEQCLVKSMGAFEKWSNEGDLYKGECFQKLATLLNQHKEALSLEMATTMGKLITEAQAEIDKCIWLCEWIIDNGPEYLEQRIVQTDASHSSVVFEPMGLIFGIMPWNFPLWQVFRFMVPTLYAGNVVLLKHSPQVPEISKKIEIMCIEAGFYEGVVQCVHIDHPLAERLIADQRVQGVAFTGSVEAGRRIAQLASQNLKPHLLELGGNDCFVVCEDAELDAAIDGALKSRYSNAGQVCIAAKRFYVHRSLLDRFLEDFKENTQLFCCGDPTDKLSSMAPLARYDLAQNLYSQTQELFSLGFNRIYGFDWHPDRGCHFEPQIFVAPQGALYDKELFGPVAVIYSFEDDAQLAQEINQSQFGLSASIWGQDLNRIESLAKKIRAGSVFINGISKSDPRLPIGGVKNSGYGRELGVEGVRYFTHCKALWSK